MGCMDRNERSGVLRMLCTNLAFLSPEIRIAKVFWECAGLP